MMGAPPKTALQNYANPHSPYSYMPVMPSSTMEPSMTSTIDGREVTHNIPYLSTLYKTQMNRPERFNKYPAQPGTNTYDYTSNPAKMPTQEDVWKNMFRVAQLTANQAVGQAVKQQDNNFYG